MRRWLFVLAVVAVTGLALAAPIGSGAPPAARYLSRPRAPASQPVSLVSSMEQIPDLEASLVAEGLDRPTHAVAAPDRRLFVTEKSGVVRVVADGEVRSDPFLDLDAVVPDWRVEQGLLAIALHPDFEVNGRFFISLTDLDGDTRIIEYSVSRDDPNQADPRSARLVLWVEQPGQFHNGGMIQFDPEGHLLVGLGDGGFGEPHRNGADRTNLLGAILRLDVDAGDTYAIPEGNGWLAEAAPEILFSGMRNPWRFFVDAPTRSIVIGDVGQYRWEEVQVLPLDTPGLDLGWPTLEGKQCYEAETCDAAGLVLPDVVYSHAAGCAVIAGPIYRGSLIPQLEGMVVYADYCTGAVWAYSLVDGEVARTVPLVAPGTYGPILSLAVDGSHEVLLLTERGEVRRLATSP